MIINMERPLGLAAVTLLFLACGVEGDGLSASDPTGPDVDDTAGPPPVDPLPPVDLALPTDPTSVRPYFGNSWGRWEGDALVVETTNISPQQRLRGVSPSEDMKVTERFTRVDEETILYEFTVEDPTLYTEAWGGEIPIRKLDAMLYEYACHEGNYSLAGVLSGARYQERMQAQGSSDASRD